MSETEVAPAAPKRVGRPRGRKPGMPKIPGSGAKRGVAKWTSDRVRDEALPPALKLLLDVVAGEAQLVGSDLRTSADKQAGGGVWRRPTLRDRIRCAETILAKCLPDLKATELVASVDQTVRSDSEPVHDVRQISRAIISVLASAELADGASDLDTPPPLLREFTTRSMAPRSPTQKNSKPSFDNQSNPLAGGDASSGRPSDEATAGFDASVAAPESANSGGAGDGNRSRPSAHALAGAAGEETATSSVDAEPQLSWTPIGRTGAGISHDFHTDGRPLYRIVDILGRTWEAHNDFAEAERRARSLVYEERVI